MIVQEIYLDKYDWKVTVYYSTRNYNIDTIMQHLNRLNCDKDTLNKASNIMQLNNKNEGITYSDIHNKESIIIIGPTTSATEFQDTFDHEKGHLAMHISKYYNINPFSEEFQYLVGDIGHKLFIVAKWFLCDHCRQRLYGE